MFKVFVAEEPNTLDYRRIAALYEDVGWGTASNYPAEDLKQAFAKNSCVILAESNDGEYIGLCRLFSDGRIDTYVQELLVAAAWQSRGVGTTLMDRVMQIFGHTSIWAFSMPNSREFLAKAGLKERPQVFCFSRKGDVETTVG
jgi:hypothetical protein